MRAFQLLTLAAIAGFTIGCGKTAPVTPDDGDPSDASGDKEKLQGIWKIDSVEVADPDDGLADGEKDAIRMAFKGDTLRIATGYRDENYMFTLDTTQNPKVLKLTEDVSNLPPLRATAPGHIPPAKRTPEREEWIYKFEGDTLVVAFRPRGGPRPTEFKPVAAKGPRGISSKPGAARPTGKYYPPVLVLRLKKTDEATPPARKRRTTGLSTRPGSTKR